MKINVILKENNRDNYTLKEDNVFYLDSIFSNPKNSKIENSIVSHNIYDYLSSKGHFKLCPKNNLVGDFANIAISVYSIDQIANREENGYLAWSRFFTLHIPVYNVENWNKVKSELETILSYLSGDKWILNFRECNESFPSFLTSKFKPEKVCLFSGGMDSFIGINDLLSKNDNLATVSHHKGGNSGELRLQKTITSNLKKEHKDKNIVRYNFYVQGKKNEILKGEKTQRARSILFLSLALLVANTASNTTPIIIPENGLISLNIPLTPARGGSHSTKTTHPRYLSTLNDIFQKVGIRNKIENPYRFLTKGEMLKKVMDNKFVNKNILSTISCSKPGYYLQWKKNRKKDEEIQIHCGHCVPCIIRRASLYANNLDSKKNYVIDVLSNSNISDDYTAFKIATHKFKNKKDTRLAFLKSGYMNISENDIIKYVNMYNRGINEVKRFITQSNGNLT